MTDDDLRSGLSAALDQLDRGHIGRAHQTVYALLVLAGERRARPRRSLRWSVALAALVALVGWMLLPFALGVAYAVKEAAQETAASQPRVQRPAEVSEPRARSQCASEPATQAWRRAEPPAPLPALPAVAHRRTLVSAA